MRKKSERKKKEKRKRKEEKSAGTVLRSVYDYRNEINRAETI